ncbi:hypothetical protein JXD38_06755 [candidate division WOR-3 bacterium]|nr:hypothetical protein [candidate division WOR-3 bacterium]
MLLFAAYRWVGPSGPAILNAVVAGFIFYFLYKLLERNNVNMLVNFAVLCLGLATITAYLSGRPAMFTVAFFAFELYILTGWTLGDAGTGRGRRGLIWLIPPMVALWANLHPGFVVGPLLILLFLPLCRAARDRWILTACLAASCLAVVINPYGWRMLMMPLETVRGLHTLQGLAEWAGVSGWEAVLWGGIVALVACGLTLRRQRFPVVLLASVAAVAAGISSRNMPLFGVVAVLVIGRTLLPALAPRLGRVGIVRKFDVTFEAAGGWFWAIAIPLVLAGAARLGVSPAELEFDFSQYPEAAVRYVEDNGCPDNLFVRETWSGYLLWAMPDRRLFFDAKGGFSPEAIEAHSRLFKPRPGWRDVVDRYNIATLLLEPGTPLAVLVSEAGDWRREYADSLAEVFVRRPQMVDTAPRDR